MSNDVRIFSVDVLRDYAAKLLEAGGYNRTDARASAELLVWANLRGVDSHGVLRIPRYVEMVRAGQIRPGATPQVLSEHGATALIDAGLAPGVTGMTLVAETAWKIAKRYGVGLCVARRVTHAGAIGFFAEYIANSGMIGIVMTASKPLMAYPGARGEAISTNPIAIAAPSVEAEEPILLDMSTAAVALGKIMAARDAGRQIAPGWAVDENGMETTDPSKIKTLLPMAGPKGAGLSLMIEVLSSVLSGNPLIATALAGEEPSGFNGLAIAIDPASFGDHEEFLREVSRLKQAIHDLPPVEVGKSVVLPGERGRRTADERRASGVTIATGTVENLSQLAAKLGVKQPEAGKC